jgi:hypothetical protein
MAEPAANDRKALIRRVDELVQRQQAAHEDVPLLTEIVDSVIPPRITIGAQDLATLADKVEKAVLAQLGPEIDRAIESAQAGLKTSIAASVHRAVREALAPLGKP